MRTLRVAAAWIAVAIVCVVPIIIATTSPLHEWRSPTYIAATFGGVIALSLMLLQPLLASGFLPGVSSWSGRRVHQWLGMSLVILLLVHVIGLWITSPPDVIDALLFVSATPFSIWGVIAMWSIFVSASLMLFRRRLGRRKWRISHRCLAAASVLGTVVHTMLIEGTMGMFSKAVFCAVLVVATVLALAKR